MKFFKAFIPETQKDDVVCPFCGETKPLEYYVTNYDAELGIATSYYKITYTTSASLAKSIKNHNKNCRTHYYCYTCKAEWEEEPTVNE
jgi:ribosomal protein L37AE/L43A